MPHVELPQAEFKVVLLGDTNTGKTSLVLRFVEGTYKDHRNATIGAFFLTKRLTVDSTMCCKLLLWDTSGQEQFQRLALTYYKQAAAAIICIDLSSNDHDQAIRTLESWLEQVQHNITSHRIVLVIAGCKADLIRTAASDGAGSSLSLLEDQIKIVADRFGAIYVRTSAKNNQGVTETFQRTSSLVLQCQHEAVSGRGRPIPVTIGGGGAVSLRNPNKSLHRSVSPTINSSSQGRKKSNDVGSSATTSSPASSPSRNHHHRIMSANKFTTREQHQTQLYSSSPAPDNRHDSSTMTAALDDHDVLDPAYDTDNEGSPNLLNKGPKIMCDNGLLICSSGAEGTSQECVIL